VATWRNPIGVYSRNTPDWFQAKQCFGTAYADFSSASPIVVGATGTNSNTAAVPAGVRINDLLLACFNVANDTQPPTPGTWNLLQTLSGTAVNYWWWKYVQKGDPTSYTSSNSLTITGGNLVAVRGAAVGSNNPFDVMANGQPNANPMTIPAINGSASEPELYLLQLYCNIFNAWGSVAGYTQLANISDPVSGNSPGMALYSNTGINFASTSATHTATGPGTEDNYQQVLIPRASYFPYASLYNNATDGSVLFVTGLKVEFDAEDQLQLALNQGADAVEYEAPYGTYSKNPLIQQPVGLLYQVPASTFVNYLYQSPPTITEFQLYPGNGDYIAIIPPGWNLSVTNGNFGAKRMGAFFDYLVLPNAS
jgi:hypothetical protein